MNTSDCNSTRWIRQFRRFCLVAPNSILLLASNQKNRWTHLGGSKCKQSNNVTVTISVELQQWARTVQLVSKLSAGCLWFFASSRGLFGVLSEVLFGAIFWVLLWVLLWVLQTMERVEFSRCGWQFDGLSERILDHALGTKTMVKILAKISTAF